MKRKWLIGLLSILMALAMCFGFAACGGDEGGGTEQGGQQGSGTQTDQEIADAAIASLKTLVKDGETPSAYSVLGQTKVNGTMYDIVWTVTSTDVTNISDYVQIGTMDASTKQITIGIVKGVDPIAYKLKATVTVNSASASMEVTKTIPAKPKDAAGTLDDPYSPSKVIEIASTLGTAGTYYYSDADKGNEVPTVVWVEGYIVNCGNGTQFGSAAVGWVYIADEYDANKTYNNTNSLCVYRIEYDEENLTSFDDLALGKKIKLHGHIEWYQGKNDSAPYAELASFKKADGSFSDIYCDYLEKEERTPAQKIELALSKVNATMTVTVADDVELPVSSVKDVTFEWSTTDTTYTVSDNKLHVSSLPTDEDKQITITVKATCGTENDTKDVTVTIKKAADISEKGASVDNPYSVADVAEILKGLSHERSTYYTDENGTPKAVYIRGIVTDAGSEQSWGYKEVYIADTAGDTENDVYVYSLNYGTIKAENITEFKAGDTIIICGYLEVYVSSSKVTEEITSWNENGTYHNATLEAYTAAGSTTPGGDESAAALTLKSDSFTVLDDAQTSGYAKYKGTHTVGDYQVTIADVMPNTYSDNKAYNVIQFKAESGTLTLTGEFTSITLVVASTYLYSETRFPQIKAGDTTLEYTKVKEEATNEQATSNGKAYDITLFTVSYEVTTTGSQTIEIKKADKGALYVLSIEFNGVGSTTPGGGTTDPADSDVIYSLNSDEQVKGKNSAYANNCDVECNGVTWNVEGNSNEQPWRFGGKSMTEAVDRKLTGKTAITGTVAKITLQLTDSGSITINSVTLKVYNSDPTADGAVAIATKNIEYQKDTEITITPDAGSEWTDCYYQLIFNVTVTGGSNKYVAISKLEFSKAPAAAAASVETPVAILPGDEH